ncbi:MAG TPA: hypothetical protein DCG06_07620 [Deltaproteobacteria bacterium]|nr:hypothetical protein [Deltaproteobacteria bacterium]
MPARFYIALLHHPVVNRDGEVVTTSITNIDVHDIARSARTYDVDGFFIGHPVLGMRKLTERILWHWMEGHGATYNPTRGDALQFVRISSDLDQILAQVENETGALPTMIATSARPGIGTIGYPAMSREIAESETPFLLLLGTGYGLTSEILERCTRRLAPIDGASDYNHLSVRAAAAIMLDRLFGQRKQ